MPLGPASNRIIRLSLILVLFIPLSAHADFVRGTTADIGNDWGTTRDIKELSQEEFNKFLAIATSDAKVVLNAGPPEVSCTLDQCSTHDDETPEGEDIKVYGCSSGGVSRWQTDSIAVSVHNLNTKPPERMKSTIDHEMQHIGLGDENGDAKHFDIYKCQTDAACAFLTCLAENKDAPGVDPSAKQQAEEILKDFCTYLKMHLKYRANKLQKKLKQLATAQDPPGDYPPPIEPCAACAPYED